MAVKVGLIGLGGMGGVHLGCYQKNTAAEVVAVCDIDEARLRPGAGTALNIGGGANLDLGGIATTLNFDDLLNNPEIELIDICLPTPQHAAAAIAALRAGKHVLCEKPMAFTVAQCEEMEAAVASSGKQLLIGHCLRHWGEYRIAAEIIAGGKYGKALYANFHRGGGTPWWSYNDWLRDGAQSGGVILDMHIHDVDAALWWFGKPATVTASGLMQGDLPVAIDALWHYDDGPVVALHSAWDDHSGGFAYGFTVVLEGATIVHNSALDQFQLLTGGREGTHVEELKRDAVSAYQHEIDYMIAHLQSGEPVTRVTSESSRQAVEVVLQELRQVAPGNPACA